jgi:surface carbohydrate biosynthesis protein (TIGR04326 family)
MINSKQVSLVVLDSDSILQGNSTTSILYWSKRNVPEGTHSIPVLVENNERHFIDLFLAYIHDFGNVVVQGKSIKEWLLIRDNFSYWWMTLLSEKSNLSKSPQINEVIKMMAFKEWLEGSIHTQITLISPNAALAKAMRFLCTELDVAFEWDKTIQRAANNSLLKRIYRLLPYPLQGLVWLVYHLFTRWPLKGIGLAALRESKAKITFVSYLFNLVPESANLGRYESRYWTTLPDFLDVNKIKTNWLHIYVEDALLPNAAEAKKIINKFNQSHAGNQAHVTLHSFLSIGLVFKVLQDWYHLLKISKNISVSLNQNLGYIRYLIEDDFVESITGRVAVSNLLNLALFEKAMTELPIQDKGCYLQENQGWEFAFIHAWKSSGHGSCLVGVPHTPIKFWDLRRYFDPRSYNREGLCDLPLPDYVGMNGEAARMIYLNHSYPEAGLIELEALRYLHLNRPLNYQADSAVVGTSDKVQVLVLGDYHNEKTTQQMGLLRKAHRYIDKDLRYLVKPHPACPILVEDYPELNLVVTNEPIPILIDKSSLVYTSSTTSAAVDAYCFGKSVIVILDPKGINLSPLKGWDGVTFVSTAEELADVMNGIDQIDEVEVQGKDYFYLNSKLPRWKDLLVKYNKILKK